MKSNKLSFKNSIESIACNTQLYTRADIGWSLTVAYNDEGLLETEIKILHIMLYGEEIEQRLVLQTFNIEIINDYCLCLDTELKIKSMSIDHHERTIQINF